jgi:NADH-quinone oxidoreductase subunit L
MEAQSNAINFLWVVPALPLIGAFINLTLGRKLSRQTVHFVAVAAIAASFFVTGWLVIWPLRQAYEAYKAGNLGSIFELKETLYTWIEVGNFKVELAFRLDPLSSVMTLIVTFCSTLIHIYSTGYMEHEKRYAAYFGYLNLFTGAMLILVLGANMPVMFIGWEGVGLCSYLLIGFWFENEAYATAGRKAFVVNRIGDCAFLLGMFLLYWATQGIDGGTSLDFTALRTIGESQPEVYEQMYWGRERLAAAACVLLFIGAAGKSAQIPLYVWLPDAMAGPTPVSALIHAATMVTAGVYMVARMSWVFAHSTTAMAVVAIVGALTALFAAFMAFAQTDLKKVLAYSTVSQLGFMFVGVGTGNWTAAIFHLGTHAFFKAGLFLGAGSVMHGMEGSGDIRIMGGLKKYLPVTHLCFLVYCLAIAGFPLFSGFFSKDSILAGAWAAHHEGWPPFLGKALWGTLIVAALGTAFYMWRLYFLVFSGPYRGKEHVAHPHESPVNMTGPLVILAVLALGAGYIGMPHVFPHLPGSSFLPEWLAHSVKPVFHGEHGIQVLPHLSVATEWILMGAATAAGLLGIGLAAYFYRNGPSPAIERWTADGAGKALYDASLNKLWVDEIYEAVLIKPFRFVARGLFEIVDRFMIDTVVVNGLGYAVQTFSRVSRWIQNGMVQRYLVGVVIGAAAIFLWTSRADEPSFSWRAVPAGVEFTAQPGNGLRKDSIVKWDFDGDGRPDDGATGTVIVKRRGEVASRVTLFIADPVWGKKTPDGEPKEWRKVTRKVELPAALSSALGDAAAGGAP